MNGLLIALGFVLLAGCVVLVFVSLDRPRWTRLIFLGTSLAVVGLLLIGAGRGML